MQIANMLLNVAVLQRRLATRLILSPASVRFQMAERRFGNYVGAFCAEGLRFRQDFAPRRRGHGQQHQWHLSAGCHHEATA